MTSNDISVHFGNDSKRKKVFWTPKNEKNPHLITVGGSGSGKTEALKAIMLELKKQKVSSLILDFHNDFKVFADNLVKIDRATLHPLEIQINEKPIDVCYKVSKMVANIFSLGDVQEAVIRDAIKMFYEKSGITNLKIVNSGQYRLLPFSVFKDILYGSQIQGPNIQKLIAKISVLFDVDLFMEADSNSVPIDNIIQQLSVIELLDFPTDEVKSLVADLLLNKLIYHLYMRGKSDDYWLYVVIDEAHRMMYPGSPVELLLRESRKYGVGIILASQRPTDFTETILANAGTILAFQASLDKDAVFLSKQLRIPKDNFQKLNTPGLGYCLFSSQDHGSKVQIIPVDKRKEFKEMIDGFDESKSAEYFDKELKRIETERKRVEKLVENNKEFKVQLKECGDEMFGLKAEIERKVYVIELNEMEIKKLTRKNLVLAHENEKLKKRR